MSKQCHECGQPLTVNSDPLHGLSIGCECDVNQSIKVASKLPDRWA